MRRIALQELILRHYSRSALIPILSIELALLVLYFGVSSYINLQTKQTLRREVGAVMPHFMHQRAQQISRDFAQISRQTSYFARAHAELLERLDDLPPPKDAPSFAVAPTGALYQQAPTSGSSLYFVHASTLTPKQHQKAEKTALLDPLYRHIVDDTPHVVAAYFNTYDNMNRLYPFILNVYEQYPPDLRMMDYNFYYLADERHDPTRQTVWTGVYLDPAGNGWMLSSVAPVYRNDVLEGVVGLDVTIKVLVEELLNLTLPWQASAFLVDQNGMILAMPGRIEKLLGLTELKDHVYSSAIAKEQLKPEQYNLFKNPNLKLGEGLHRAFRENARSVELATGSESLLVFQSVIPETGWHLFVAVQTEELYRSVHQVESLAHRIGYWTILVMLAFYAAFFWFLRRQANRMSDKLSRPMGILAAAVGRVGTQSSEPLKPSGIAELDSLTASFNTMVAELDVRNLQLVESRIETKLKEKDAQVAYAQGMFESASGYLHNVGNSVAALGASILDLQEVVDSTGQYATVFARLRECSEPALLDQFERVLVQRTAPLLRQSTENITRIKDAILQTIRYQQHTFNATGKAIVAAEFDVSELVARVCDDYDCETSRIRRTIAPGLLLKQHRYQIYHGLANVVKNAREATTYGGEIFVTLEASSSGVTVKVSDTGVGIASDDLPRILTAGFTSKPGGHGLGLHSFSIFLAAHGGRLRVTSAGLGCGATIVVEVPHA